MTVCNRCLINLDARTTIRARFTDRILICETPNDPPRLLDWAEAMLAEGAITIEVDANIDRFRPVSTWHGDPVCSPHLWTLVDQEMRRGYR